MMIHLANIETDKIEILHTVTFLTFQCGVVYQSLPKTLAVIGPNLFVTKVSKVLKIVHFEKIKFILA